MPCKWIRVGCVCKACMLVYLCLDSYVCMFYSRSHRQIKLRALRGKFHKHHVKQQKQGLGTALQVSRKRIRV